LHKIISYLSQSDVPKRHYLTGEGDQEKDDRTLTAETMTRLYTVIVSLGM